MNGEGALDASAGSGCTFKMRVEAHKLWLGSSAKRKLLRPWSSSDRNTARCVVEQPQDRDVT
jgi:hypothetical protein